MDLLGADSFDLVSLDPTVPSRPSRFSYSKLTQLQVNGARDRSQRLVEKAQHEQRLQQAKDQWQQAVDNGTASITAPMMGDNALPTSGQAVLYDGRTGDALASTRLFWKLLTSTIDLKKPCLRKSEMLLRNLTIRRLRRQRRGREPNPCPRSTTANPHRVVQVPLRTPIITRPRRRRLRRIRPHLRPPF